MVKHIVMWKWKDEVKQDHPEALVASLQERFKRLRPRRTRTPIRPIRRIWPLRK